MEAESGIFFREATLRICGSLEIEKFLYDSFLYLKNKIPLDFIYLTHPSRNMGKQVLLATASNNGGEFVNSSLTLPSNMQEYLSHPEKEIVVVPRAKDHPVANLWVNKGLIGESSSILILRLVLDKKVIGAVSLVVKEPDSYTNEHAQMLSLLSEPFAIALSNSVRYYELKKLKNNLAEDNQFLRNELIRGVADEIIGADLGLKAVMELVHKVAPLISPVLLLGETGTGKEVVASALHRLSQSNQGSFVKVNCGAIPESLVDSELFGHEKGAFTGATSRKIGRFERANNGTIFLDEVAELKPEVQVRLLRVLQEGEIERVGGTDPVKVNIRVIAATHRDLESMVKDGSFREDFFFRLNVFPIRIPSLRSRKVDIPALVRYFIKKKSQEMDIFPEPEITDETLQQLQEYTWPGNVRELQNAVERALILHRKGPILFSDIGSSFTNPSKTDAETTTYSIKESDSENFPSLNVVMSQHIKQALKMAEGKVEGKKGAAGLLQVNPSTLRKRMRKLGIPFGRRSISKPQ